MRALYIDRSNVTSLGMLQTMLQLTRGIHLVAHLKDFELVNHYFREKMIDVLIFNTSALSQKGIPFLRGLRARNTHVRVYAMLSVLDRISIEYLRQCRNVSGIFSVETTVEGFHSFISRSVCRNEAILSSDVEEFYYRDDVTGNFSKHPNLFDNLTRREFDVLILSLDGLRNKEIADMLNISAKTVCTHRCNIREKFHVRTMQEVYKISLELKSDLVLQRQYLDQLRSTHDSDQA